MDIQIPLADGNKEGTSVKGPCKAQGREAEAEPRRGYPSIHRDEPQDGEQAECPYCPVDPRLPGFSVPSDLAPKGLTE